MEPVRVPDAIHRAVTRYLNQRYGADSVYEVHFNAFRQPESGRASVAVKVDFKPVRVTVFEVWATRGRLDLTGPEWKVTRAELSDLGRTGWEPEFEVAAYAWALRRWGKGTRLFLAEDAMDAVLSALRKTWPTLQRATESSAGGTRFSVGISYLPVPPNDFRMVSVETTSGASVFLEAARSRAGWTFQELTFSPGALPVKAQVAVFASLLDRRRQGTLVAVVAASEDVRRRLRASGFETIARERLTGRRAEYERRGYRYIDLKDRCWASPTRAYVRVDIVRDPPGSDIGYENFGTVRVTRSGKGWEVLDLGDWQGE